MAKEQMLSIDSSYFTQVRFGFDAALQNLVKKMMDKGADQADISVKCTLSILHAEEDDGRESMIPSIKFKVSTAITEKSDYSGDIVNDQVELQQSENGDWILGNRVTSQLSML